MLRIFGGGDYYEEDWSDGISLLTTNIHRGKRRDAR